MTEIVSKSEVYHLTQEYQRTWKELLNLLLARMKALGKNPAGNVTVKVEGKDVYKSLQGKNPTLNNLKPQHIDKFKTAVTNPQQLQGSLSIFIDNEKVFEVKDGVVLKDDLQLILSSPKQQQADNVELHLDAQALKEKGCNIVTSAKQLLDSFLNRKEINQAADGTCCYTSGCYIFSCREDKVTVVSKETGQVVLNNDGFTDRASEEDVRMLQKVTLAAAKLKEIENEQIQETVKPTFGLKLKN